MEIVPQFAGSDWLFMALVAESLGKGHVDLTPHTVSNWLDLFSNAWILPDALRNKTSDSFARRALSVYKGRKKFDAMTIGPPSGSLAHISSLLGAPYLASEFWILDLSPISAQAHDRMEPFLKRCMAMRDYFFEKEKGADAVLHYDPVHNRSLDRLFSNFEAKMGALPPAYEEFILSRLKKRGFLLLNNCQYRWPQYVLDDRTRIQIGGYGGISPLEYQTGSERIDSWLESQGSSHRGGWTLDLPTTDGSETEWGITSRFISSLTEFCDSNDITLYSLNSSHPYGLSEPLLSLYEGRTLFVDCYWNTSPRFSLHGHPTLWSPYSDEQSLKLCEKTLSKFDFSRYYLSLYPAEGPDIPSAKSWKAIFPEEPKLLAAQELPIKEKLPALSSIVDYRRRIRRFKMGEPLELPPDRLLDALDAKLIS